MEKTLTIATKILLFLIPVVIIIFFIDKELYYTIIQEDGWIEYLTALLLLITSILLFVKIFNVGLSKGYQWLIFNLILALGLFFGFGEEISWGQRIFNVTSNDFFIENNLQGETNLHNLMINGVKINKWIFAYAFTIIFGIYFLFSQLVYKKNNFVKRIVDKIGLPIPKVSQSLAILILTILIMLIPDSKKWEVWEYLFAIILLMTFIDPYNTSAKLLQSKE